MNAGVGGLGTKKVLGMMCGKGVVKGAMGGGEEQMEVSWSGKQGGCADGDVHFLLD